MNLFHGSDVKNISKEEEVKEKVPTFKDIIKSFKSIHEFCKIPQNLTKPMMQTMLLILVIAILTNLFSFFIEIGKSLVIAGNSIGWLFFILFLARDVIFRFLNNYSENVKSKFDIELKKHNNIIACRVLKQTTNKVKKDGDTLSKNILLLKITEYLYSVYGLRRILLSGVIGVVVTIISFLGTILVVFNARGVSIFSFSVFIISLIAFLAFIKQDKVAQIKSKNNKEKSEILWPKRYNAREDLSVLEAINEKHFDYMSNNFISADYDANMAGVNNMLIWNNQKKITEVITFSSVFLVSILLMNELHWNLSINSFLEIFAFATIFLNFINGIRSILSTYSGIKESVIDKEVKEDDFNLIMKSYDEENNKKLKEANSDCIEISPYKYSIDNFELDINSNIKLENGKMILLKGPSGVGKSTLIDLITGQRGEIGYNIKAIRYTCQMKFGSNNILDEILLGDKLNETKLFEILTGVQSLKGLKGKAKKNKCSVLEYLSKVHDGELSDGIRQRLIIARILYHLDDNVDLLLFDEPISFLDKKTAIKVVEYIKKYCNKDRKRYVLIATHQYEWVTKYIDNEVVFKQLSQTHTVIK